MVLGNGSGRGFDPGSQARVRGGSSRWFAEVFTVIRNRVSATRIEIRERACMSDPGAADQRYGYHRTMRAVALRRRFARLDPQATTAEACDQLSFGACSVELETLFADLRDRKQSQP
jgi:hypothetical protein